eukprot:jgi/Pico_ML_1/56043/g1641.t1
MVGAEDAAQVPNELKGLRTCLVCHLVKSFEQFATEGCDNCTFLSMEDDTEKVYDCTSVNFEGIISVVDPRKSWCAKWMRLTKAKPGCYAMQVDGELPLEIQEMMQERGIRLR